MTDGIHDVLLAVGPRLRALRMEAGATLAQVAATTGISASTLSRLESGQRKPTLELLLPLSKEYQVPLDEMVGAPAVGDPRVALVPEERHGMTFVPLTQHAGGLQAFKQTLPAGFGTGDVELQVHEGYDWVYVLSGKLRLVLGHHDLVLEPGEAAEFDTRVPHAIGNAAEGPTEVLSLYGTQGERVHLRAGPRRRSDQDP